MAVRRLLAAALLTSVLAGCSDDEPTPAPDPSPSTSRASASESPSSSPSADAETPEEFIRRWQEAANLAQRSGDTSGYRALTHTCRSCDAFADLVDRIYRDGGYIRTEGARVTSISRRANEVFDVEVRSSPTEYRESSSARVRRLPGGQVTYRVTIERRRDAWVIDDYAQLSEAMS
jgi:hypothetical protein